ncbi:MAG: hypothetical protein HRU25_14790 [Psychrobium sp.]|nr:hypothetical protein [Psychrobium sp.]
MNIDSPDLQQTIEQICDTDVELVLKSELSTALKAIGISSYPYSAYELAMNTVITRQQQGLAQNESSEQLMDRLDQSTSDIRNAYRNTSDILADLG